MEKTFFQRLSKVRLFDLLHIPILIAAIIPAIFLRVFWGRFWLITECRNEARDNGYWLFAYICGSRPEQKAVYAIDRNCADYEEVKKLVQKSESGRQQIVEYGGFLHWVCYLACSMKISSQKTGGPCDALCCFLDMYFPIKKKSAFLQHGVIKDDLPYVHYKKAWFRFFATTAKREYEFVQNTFGYPAGVVRQTGLCRFDGLEKGWKDNGLVLIMPTWRQWIANGDYGTKNVEQHENLHETDYFQKWQEFLLSKELQQILAATGSVAVFIQHRKMAELGFDFHNGGNKNIVIKSFLETDMQMALNSASMLVTDYSSIAMDFAYMGKPIVYYQFDFERFRKHHLPDGYFDYVADGFGPVTSIARGAAGHVERYAKDAYQPDSFYLKRAENFFDLKDKENCRRNYDAIKEAEMG